MGIKLTGVYAQEVQWVSMGFPLVPVYGSCEGMMLDRVLIDCGTPGTMGEDLEDPAGFCNQK